MKKFCPCCNQLLPIDYFYKDKSKKSGFDYFCRECNKQRCKHYYKNNKEEIIKRTKQYFQDHKNKWSKYMKQYYQNNKEKQAERNKQYRQKNREKILEQRKRYRQNHKKERQEYYQNHKREIRAYYQNNKERIAKQSAQNYQDNKERYTEYKRRYFQNNKEYFAEWQKQRRKENPKIRLNDSIAGAIWLSLKKRNISKNRRPWESLVNFTLQELMIRLESLFQNDMTWENYGKWHLDHIKPLSLFDFEGIGDPGFKECWALENLQPLWAKDNISKGNKYQIEN